MGCLPLILFVVLSAISQNEAKFSYGEINATGKNWVYLDRFAFDAQDNLLRFSFEFPAEYSGQSIIFYTGTSEQWFSTIGENITCEEKEKLADRKNKHKIFVRPTGNQNVFNGMHQDFDKLPTINECHKFKRDNKIWYQCNGKTTFSSKHPNWWYFVLSNCDSDIGLYLNYTLFMANDDSIPKKPLSYHYSHFSFEELYVLRDLCVALTIEGILVGISFALMWYLKHNDLLHAGFLLFFFSLALDFGGLMVLQAHYKQYEIDGNEASGHKMGGLMLRQCSSGVFVFLLLLTANGYKTTRDEISMLHVMMCFIFVSIFMFFNFMAILWKHVIYNPAIITAYTSEWSGAYLTTFMRAIAWTLCLSFTFESSIKFPNQRNMFLIMSFLMSMWFVGSPLSMFKANYKAHGWIHSEPKLGGETKVMVFGFVLYLSFILAPVLPEIYKSVRWHLKYFRLLVKNIGRCIKIRIQRRLIVEVNKFYDKEIANLELYGIKFENGEVVLIPEEVMKERYENQKNANQQNGHQVVVQEQ